jgi:hypothetical protein
MLLVLTIFALQAKGAPPRGFKFNVSHDSNLVVLACSEAGQGVEVGVDVMRCALPGHESLRSFVSVLSDQVRKDLAFWFLAHQHSLQLTPLERISVLSAANGPRGDTEPIQNLYRIWALKEAYTKVLGLGLGFDFSRVEYDVNSGRVRVDRTSDLPSWEFVETIIDVQGAPCAITAARCGIAGASGGQVLRRHGDDGRWLIRMDARNMLEEYLRLAQ